MTTSRPGTRGSFLFPAGVTSVVVAPLAWTALVWLGVGAPPRTHPLTYFGFVFLGAGAFALLLAGAGALTLHARAAAGQLTISLVFGVRNLVLAMWWCTIVVDALGCLVVFATAGRGGTASLTPATAIAVPAVAVLVIALGAVTSFSVRRRYAR